MYKRTSLTILRLYNLRLWIHHAKKWRKSLAFLCSTILFAGTLDHCIFTNYLQWVLSATIELIWPLVSLACFRYVEMQWFTFTIECYYVSLQNIFIYSDRNWAVIEAISTTFPIWQKSSWVNGLHITNTPIEQLFP